MGIVSVLVRSFAFNVLAKCNAFCFVSFLPEIRVYSKDILRSVDL